MTVEQLLQRAEECRMTAGLLAAIAIVTALAGVAVWFSLGPGNVLLACIVVTLVTALGALNESYDAANDEKRAWRITGKHLP